jgi:hypothetical protein
LFLVVLLLPAAAVLLLSPLLLSPAEPILMWTFYWTAAGARAV